MSKLSLNKRISKDGIIDVLDKLLYLVHADYFDNPVSNDDYKLIYHLVNKQVTDALALVNSNEKADKYTKEFFKQIDKIKKLLDKDLEAIFEGDPAANSKMEIILAYPGFYAISVYRIAHELAKLDLPLIPRIMTEHAHSLTGIDINAGAKIDEYFFIDHGTGIVIGQTCVIGKHVKIYQGVTLGALSTRGGQSLKGKKRHPTIKDNVTIYAGASVLGDVTIGKNVTLGSNVFVTENVKEGSKIAFISNSSKLIQDKGVK